MLLFFFWQLCFVGVATVSKMHMKGLPFLKESALELAASGLLASLHHHSPN